MRTRRRLTHAAAVGTFIQEIKKHIKPEENGNASLESIFLFVNNSVMPNVSALMSQIYEKNKDEDGLVSIMSIVDLSGFDC